MKDCNSCIKHEQGKHPAEVWADVPMAYTCADCLKQELRFWQPKVESRHVAWAPLLPGPTIKPFDGAAQKLDTGKVGLHLLPTAPLEEIAKVLDFGAKKYAANQWRKGMKWSRLLAALWRHTFAWARGIDNDPETGLSHLAHAGCCLLFLLQYVSDAKAGDKTASANDDRYKEVA